MEQIFMLEVLVKSIILKVEEPEKDEWEIAEAIEAAKNKAEADALAEALKGVKKKGKKAKPKKKKGKKGKKGPVGPSEEEMKFMQSCTMQMTCLPVFDFYIAHDNFIAPPPPPPPEKKGKKKKKAKPKKKKKGKAKVAPRKLELPSEPLPIPPFFGVGNVEIFLSRPSKLKEIMEVTPLNITVWNRDQEMNCIGFVMVPWHESFLKCLEDSGDANPMDMYLAELRDTSPQETFSNTVELLRHLQCEENLKPSGEVHFFVRLTCLGNRILTYFVSLPEMDRLPGRKYLYDEHKLKDMEVVRHWPGTDIDEVPPVAHFFGAPDIMRSPIIPVEKETFFEDFKAPFTDDELIILSMGFPKGPCGGSNCLKRLGSQDQFRGSQDEFIFGEKTPDKRKYKHGVFVNKRDVHGPCGRLDCPLAKKVRDFICNTGTYKTCKKPCCKDYY